MFFLKYSAAFLIFVLTSVSAFPQDVHYSGPKNDDSYIPIGWSSDGTLFAYGWFETTQMISNGSCLVIKVQDLITDKVLFEIWNVWDEGNVGDGIEAYYPSTPKKAWELVADKINKKFKEFDIWEGTGAGVLNFPMGNDKNLNIEIRELNNEPGYQVYAYSNELGEKMISSNERSTTDEISVMGYVWNPGRIRIGVIMNRRSFEPYSTYWVIGCHVKNGFKKTAK